MTETGNTDADVTEESTQQQPGSSARQTTDFGLRRNLYRGSLVLFVLLAVLAVVQLYVSVNATIETFITHEYQPLFRAAFNLVVLLVAGIGISWSVRELGGE